MPPLPTRTSVQHAWAKALYAVNIFGSEHAPLPTLQMTGSQGPACVARRHSDKGSACAHAFSQTATPDAPGACWPLAPTSIRGAGRRDSAARFAQRACCPGCEPGQSAADANRCQRAPCDRSPRASRRPTAIPSLTAPVRAAVDRHGVEAALVSRARRASGPEGPRAREQAPCAPTVVSEWLCLRTARGLGWFKSKPAGPRPHRHRTNHRPMPLVSEDVPIMFLFVPNARAIF